MRGQNAPQSSPRTGHVPLLNSLPKHDIVLVGIGHTNAHVLRMWRMSPIPNARLTCVSNFAEATYSGMLPGTLAGYYAREQMQIDLVRLCSAAGARLVVDTPTGIDRQRRELQFASRPAIPYDALSLGIGSVPESHEQDRIDPAVVPIKPMQTFLARLDARIAEVGSTGSRPLRIAIVGGGAGGVEIAFCLPRHLSGTAHVLTLIDRNDLNAGLNHKAAKLVRRELDRRSVRTLLGREAHSVGDGQLELTSGERHSFDLILWATKAVAPEFLKQTGLPVDEHGFLRTQRTLQSVGDTSIFAVGDSGSIEASPLPKAGVFAVRQGPVLFENLKRFCVGQQLTEFKPQQNFLKLLNTGDGRAIGDYKGVALHSTWCWRLKDRIDRRFMEKYQDYRPAPAMQASEQSVNAATLMRCAGCGGKVAGSVLSRALARLEIPPSDDVLVGLEQPDDAAILRWPSERPLVTTVDFFSAPWDDPFLVGRIAALNSASDIFAMGARPRAALALVTLPVGPERQQEQLLYEVLAGSVSEFRQMGAALVGGHTIEGAQLTVGFSMLADGGGSFRTKAMLRAGDHLVLTKPLGTGVLLAAHMQAKCKAAWTKELLDTMLLSNSGAASLVDEFDILGVTDVTGFGLAGHLLEMLKASRKRASLTLSDIPLLPGTADLIVQGIESTLAPANCASEADIQVRSAAHTQSPQYKSLFDPQTSGGLLLGVPERNVQVVLDRLSVMSGIRPAFIGRVLEVDKDEPRLTIS